MKKRFCSVILIFILLLSVFSFTVSAAADEIIDSADITVSIAEDGSASVTEKWTVSYINSSDMFYRNFDVYSASGNMTLLEAYEDITDISVKIDGNSIIKAENGINTYSVSERNGTTEIAVNCPSAQTVREYQIDYILTGAVKKTGGEVCFASMILGDTFIYTSNNVSVSVVFPEGTKELRVPQNSQAVIEGNKATFISKRVFDTFSVEVYADAEMFEKDALVSYSGAKDSLHKAGNLIKEIIPWIVAVILAVLVIIFVLFPDRIRRISSEKRAKKLNYETAELPSEFTPCAAYKMLCPASRRSPGVSSKKVPVLFGMAILECIEKGYIIPDGYKLIVGTPSEKTPEYISSVLNFLKIFSDKKGNKFVIDKSFAEKVSNECMIRYDVITNYLATFYTLIPSADSSFFRNEKNKQLYENAFLVKEYICKEKIKTDFAQALDNVLSGMSARDTQVFALLFGTVNSKTFAPDGYEGALALCEALREMYKVYINLKK